MKEPNLGISAICRECGSVYWNEDGGYFCSIKCFEDWEERNYDEEEEED